MSNHDTDEINILRLTFHGRLVGYLAGFHDGRNVLTFADEFKSDADRPTFSLITHPGSRVQKNCWRSLGCAIKNCIPYYPTCCQREH